MENIIETLRNVLTQFNEDGETDESKIFYNKNLSIANIRWIIEVIDDLTKDCKKEHEYSSYLEDCIRLLKNENDMLKTKGSDKYGK